jgi:hypothetical protein
MTIGSKTRVLALSAALCLALAGIARAEVEQEGTLRVSFNGKIAPHQLPRLGAAPVTVSLSGDISTTDGSTPPQLRTITMAINRHGRLDATGLPICHLHQIQPASTAEAREACPRSLVGSGFFEANVALPEQSPFPSSGKVLAFNGTLHGKPVIFAHIYGPEPLPTSFTLPFVIGRRASGTYSTVLLARLPRVAAQWGYVSGLSLKLWRRYSYGGRARSYLSAGCPAPKGFPGTTFTFARASFGFEGGKHLSSAMVRSCGVRD